MTSVVFSVLLGVLVALALVGIAQSGFGRLRKLLGTLGVLLVAVGFAGP